MLRFSIRKWLDRASRRPPARNRRRASRSIERLENRVVLSSYSVTSTLDTVDANPGDGVASDVNGDATLRAAVMDANALAGADTITLGAGVFALTISGTGENAAAAGDLDITGDLVIEGAGVDETFLDANLLDRFFHVGAGSTVTVRNATIQNGRESSGGAIENNGTLILENVNLTGNSTTLRGGAIHNNSGTLTLQSVRMIGNETRDVVSGGGNSIGGAMSSYGGTITIIGCQFANNTAAAEGGAIDARSSTISISDTAFSQNSATAGGAIRLFSGNVTLTNSTFDCDHATSFGGAIASNYAALTINGGSFTGNYLAPPPPTGAVRTGGSLYLVGAGTTSTTVTITGVTFQQTGSGDGGAIYNSNGRINLSNSTFDRVTGARGGSIWNSSGGLIHMWNTTVTGGSAMFGGAILNNSQFVMTNCTISDNTTAGGGTTSAAVANTSSFSSVNNLIAKNVGGLDVIGSFSSGGGNLIGEVRSATGFTQPTDKVGTTASPIDPLLSPLADNGGPVRTMAIAAQSPARDAGVSNGPSTDARGLPRSGNKFDIGAYEYQNSTPTAGPFDVTIDEDQVLTGQLPASDADGDTLTYELLIPATGGTIVVQPNGQFTYTPPANVSGTAYFRYRVTDGRSFSNNVDGRIVVLPVNDPPTVADQTFTIAENSPNGTFIGGIQASDIDGYPTFAEIVSGNENGAIGLNGSNGILYVADGSLLNFEAEPTITFVVRVTDDGDPAASSLATITIQLTDANDAPQPVAETFTIDENSPVGTVVDTLTVTDEDEGQSFTYEIIAASSPGTFAIDPSTGEITVADAGPVSVEDPVTWGLRIRVTDNGSPALSSDVVVFIELNNVNDPPVVADQTFTVAENSADQTFIGGIFAYDVDSNRISGEIVSGNEDGAIFFDGQYGALVVADGSLLNYETNPTITFVIRISDDNVPAASSLATITINLTDVNDRPQLESTTFTVDENSPDGTVIGTIPHDDEDLGQQLTFQIINTNSPGTFAINSETGEISVANGLNLDYESQASHWLVIEATDNGNPALSQRAVVTIDLNDVNDPPTVWDQTFTIGENAPDGEIIGYVSAFDVDSFIITGEIVSGNEDGAIFFNGQTGRLSVADGSLLDFESNSTRSFVIRISDDESPPASSLATITIQLNDVNESPQIAAQSFSIAENSANEQIVGTVGAADPDAGQLLTYAIESGNSNGAFAINATTGQITVANSGALDFEATAVFNLIVSVADDGTPGLSSSAAITITVDDQNEAPLIAAQAFLLDENSANGTVVGSVAASDPDAGQSLTYAIESGNTDAAFAIDPVTGEITVVNAAALDFEATPSFSLVVSVADSGTPGLTSSAGVTIALADLNETPEISGGAFSLAENSVNGTAVGSVTATDPDVGQSLTYAIVSGNTGGGFAIDPTTGQITVANSLVLDFETTPAFTLQVRATDTGSPAHSADATVTISLTDVVETLAVSLDVVPGDSSNTIRLNKKFEVAILSTATFDARNVNVSSVRFGKVGTENSIVRNPKGMISYSYRDVNGDGRLDLVVQIDQAKTGLQIGDTLARLTGSMLDGQSIGGSSSVIVKK